MSYNSTYNSKYMYFESYGISTERNLFATKNQALLDVCRANHSPTDQAASTITQAKQL